MTNKQRFMTAVRGGMPDMVPVSPLIHNRYAYAVLGRTGLEAMFRVHQMIGSIHHRGNGWVGVRIALPDGYREETIEIARDADGRTTLQTLWHTPYGTLRSREVWGAIPHDPHVGKTIEYCIKGEDDWRLYRRVLEDRLAGIGEQTWEDYDRVARIFGEEAVAAVNLPTPFVNMMMQRGMQQILTDLYDCPALLDSVLDLERQIARKQLAAFIASPCEIGFQDICWATGADMGPKLFQRWCLPDVGMAAGLTRVVGAPRRPARATPGGTARRSGDAGGGPKLVGLYTLGKLRELMPMLADAGVHFVETFEQNQGDLSLAEAKRLYGKRLCVMGNFDPTILAFGTVEQARAETMRCLREGMEGGGYVLITGDEVPANAKLDNLKAMVETAAEHGQYQ
jgi:hypothetical protein